MDKKHLETCRALVLLWNANVWSPDSSYWAGRGPVGMLSNSFCEWDSSVSWRLVCGVGPHLLSSFSCSVVSNSFVTPQTVAHQAPLSVGFSRQEYCSGLPFPPPGGSSRLRGQTRDSCIAGTTEPPGKPERNFKDQQFTPRHESLQQHSCKLPNLPTWTRRSEHTPERGFPSGINVTHPWIP